MARRFDQNKLVIASHNAGKVREIGALLEPFNVEVVSAGTLGLDEPEETGETWQMIPGLASGRCPAHPGFILRAGRGRTKISTLP